MVPSAAATAMAAGSLLLALATVPAPAQPAPPAAAAGTADCAPGHTQAREATSAEIQAHVRQSHKRVLTFAGYSGAEYEDPAAMLAQAAQVLARHDPRTTLVNIGATASGIGAVYALARARGFATMGIVSTQARDEAVPLSPCVDQVFFVRDRSWGGRLPGRQRLAPTSAATVANSHAWVLIGGGEIARDEGLAARRAGRPVQFLAADMNHALATRKALARGQPAPTDFRGAAHAAFAAAR